MVISQVCPEVTKEVYPEFSKEVGGELAQGRVAVTSSRHNGVAKEELEGLAVFKHRDWELKASMHSEDMRQKQQLVTMNRAIAVIKKRATAVVKKRTGVGTRQRALDSIDKLDGADMKQPSRATVQQAEGGEPNILQLVTARTHDIHRVNDPKSPKYMTQYEKQPPLKYNPLPKAKVLNYTCICIQSQ